MSIIMYFITNDTSTKLMYVVYICILQGCAQEVISGGKFPRGIKRRGQPCTCVRRT